MENKLNKRYGLFTAICMVVGIVIGSGVFFKGIDVIGHTGGNVVTGILAWLIGGTVMVICGYNFATLSTKYVKLNGVVDYSEAAVGKGYAYGMGWFVATIYYPAMTSVLAWVSARYTLVLFGNYDITSGLCMALGAFYLVLAYALNVLSPKLAGKFQVSTTVIKMVPLIIIAVGGIISGLIKGHTIDAFKASFEGGLKFKGLLPAVCACAFAYEGWIIATSINAELKEPKKHLPVALVLGTLIIVAVYVLYFIGLSGTDSMDKLGSISDKKDKLFRLIFGNTVGTIIVAFIVVSCWGTLNGLMLASTRTMYSLGARKQGPKPEVFAEVSKTTNMPTNSGVFGLIVCGFWFFYFYAANLMKPLFGVFSFDSSELPIITIYGMYIPIFIMFIVKEGKKNIMKNTVMPILAIICCAFMVFAAVYSHGYVPFKNAKDEGASFTFPVLFYLIVYGVIMAIGYIFYKKKNNTEE